MPPMRPDFVTTAQIDLPPLARHAAGCRCAGHARRRLGGALLGSGLLAGAGAGGLLATEPAQAQPDGGGPDAECRRAKVAGLVPAEQLENAAAQQYQAMLQQAAGSRALASANDPQLQRLRYIAGRIIPFTTSCNSRAARWRWEVNLLGSPELNAFCMPGGKIAFYYGILQKLQLSDDEVAVIMGHEVAHALLEHARERMAKTSLTQGVVEIGAALLGLGNTGRMFADMGRQLLSLQFSRNDESEADALGLVLSSRAGYRPDAGITLWQKMGAASKGAPPAWLSTHPSGASRIQDLENRQARVLPLYNAAAKPDRRFSPPRA